MRAVVGVLPCRLKREADFGLSSYAVLYFVWQSCYWSIPSNAISVSRDAIWV